MNILVLGDIVGESAVKRVKEILPKAIKENDINFLTFPAHICTHCILKTSKLINDKRSKHYIL